MDYDAGMDMLVKAYENGGTRLLNDDVLAKLANSCAGFILGAEEINMSQENLRLAVIMFMMGFTASEENWGQSEVWLSS